MPISPPTAHLRPNETAVIFLRGYPCAQSLVELGAAYHIDPDFFQRHLRFLDHDSTKNESCVLPSFQSSIFQTVVTNLGYHVTPQYSSLQDKRVKAADNMKAYIKGLRTGKYMGRPWKPAESIIRAFAVHDEFEFSIQQLITVCVMKVAGTVDDWKGV